MTAVAALAAELARPYRRQLGVILVAMLMEAAATLAAPWPLKIVVDYAVGSGHPPHWLRHLFEPVPLVSGMPLAMAAAGAQVLLAVIVGAASYAENYYTEGVSRWVGRDLRIRVYDHLEHLSFTFYDTHQTGLLLSTMTDDVAKVQDFVSSSVVTILVDGLTVAGILGLMLWIDWRFAAIVLFATPPLVLLVARFKRAVKVATREVRRRESEVVAQLQTDLESIRTVQAFGAQATETARLADLSSAAVDAALRARRIKSLLPPTFAMIVATCTAIVLWRGAYRILAGTMTVGSLTVLLAYLARFFRPVENLAKLSSAVAQTDVAFERIRSILDIRPEVAVQTDARDPGPSSGAVTFDHVHFAYRADTPVLKNVTFTVEPGEYTAIVGATGSGKSTLASLIPRFYDPGSGRILLDGSDLRDLTLEGLRRQIGFVLQDTALFRGTIRENIAYGRTDATDDQIVAAARLADAEEFIALLPDGYDTPVGERGVMLSGGQRQRIGIARAFIRDAPLLILDEPTSSLDTEAERIVMEGLRRLMRGRTVVMITHRLHTVRDADHIVVLHQGQVVEYGTHVELIARGGAYAELWSSLAVPAESTA
jgi:ABC-type multidrug transport system fused ATPase/permease subunit